MPAVHAPVVEETLSGDATVQRVRVELRRAVLEMLDARGLSSPEQLARHLDVLPMTAASILHRSAWPVETSLWLIERLDLPIRLSVQHGR